MRFLRHLARMPPCGVVCVGLVWVWLSVCNLVASTSNLNRITSAWACHNPDDIYRYASARTHARCYIYIHIHPGIPIHVHAYACRHAATHTSTHTLLYMHIYAHACMQARPTTNPDVHEEGDGVLLLHAQLREEACSSLRAVFVSVGMGWMDGWVGHGRYCGRCW